eukprot:9529590-Heterocapsa_arctica.AAC.1
MVERKKKDMEEAAAEEQTRLDKEAAVQAGKRAASSEEDLYELSETAPPCQTAMTAVQEKSIIAWAQTQTFLMNDPAYMIRMEDDTILKMPETEHTEPEKQ